MKVVYICHPISGDVKNNLEKIRLIVRAINLNELEILPFASYWLDCHTLDDSVQEERDRGIKNDSYLLSLKFIDELWVYGEPSNGMRHEIRLAKFFGIKIVIK